MSQKTYILENLGCANCAAKIEKRINELPGVDEAVITFATKQLRLTADDPDRYIEQMEAIARSVEPDIRITERRRRESGVHTRQEDSCNHGEHHHHDDHCGCSEHHHHDDHCNCGEHHHHDNHCTCDEDHHHDNHCTCGEDHNHHESSTPHDNKEFISILSGAALFIIGQLLPDSTPLPLTLVIFLLAYLILGWNVLQKAVSGFRNGQIFDENFLMSMATIGAFLIQEYPEAVGVMLFFRIGEYFEHKAVEKSRSSIMEAIDMRPETVNLIKDDSYITVPAEDVVPGHIILVRAGDRIPLDGTLIEGITRIDTSAVTGEPVPVSAAPGDTLVSGCLNLTGVIKMRIDKPLEDSMVSRILECVENAAAGKPKMERFITRFSRIYTPIVVAAAAFTAIVPSIITGEWSYWIYTALTFLVISCPCALVLSVPLAFFSGIGAGSSKGILFKNGLSLEAIKNIRTIVMDKTGTITKGTFEVVEIIPLDSAYTRTDLVSLFVSCEMTSNHPIASSILAHAKEDSIPYFQPETTEELAGRGIRALLSGKELLCGNKKLMEQFHIDCSRLVDANYGTEVILAVDGTLAGIIHIEDTIKQESAEAIRQIHQMGLHTAMLTGDSEENAIAIAQKTRIKTVHSRLLPEEKLTVLQKIRSKKGAVMFIGDGINDAPVLAGADVGAAMGNGADAAIEAADVVFMNKNLMSVPQAIEISRASILAAKQNVIFALIVKAFVLIFGFLKYANMWFAVFADSGVALICVLNSIRVLYRFRGK